MTKAVDWDVKHQTKQTKSLYAGYFCMLFGHLLNFFFKLSKYHQSVKVQFDPNLIKNRTLGDRHGKFRSCFNQIGFIQITVGLDCFVGPDQSE